MSSLSLNLHLGYFWKDSLPNLTCSKIFFKKKGLKFLHELIKV